MSDETNNKPINFSELARQKKEEHAARQAKYNAGIMGGPRPSIQETFAQPKRLNDLPLKEVERLAKARGLMMVTENMIDESRKFLFPEPGQELVEHKGNARERIKVLYHAIEVLKLIEEV